MSSTSNAQDLLVNVFRPTYRWDSNTGFVPSLTISNVSEIITGSLKTDLLVVSDTGNNTYIGSNAGLYASNTAYNVGLGYQAMGGAINSSNNVAVGYYALDGAKNSTSNVVLGSYSGLTNSNGGVRNVLIGPNVTVGTGSGNILIGSDISLASGTNRFQLGKLLYGDLSSGFIGVNTDDPKSAFDVSGTTLIRGKLGIQTVPNPKYSLDVNGSIFANDRFFGGRGTVAEPVYSFDDVSTSGMYVPQPSEGYGNGAFAIAVNQKPAAIFSSNAVNFFQNLDVSGTFSATNVELAAFSVEAGSRSAPTITFASNRADGFYHLADTSGFVAVTMGQDRMMFLESGDISSSRILGSDISLAGAIFTTAGCNVVGGVTLSNGNVILTGTATNSNLLVPGWFRNNETIPTVDISGGVVRAVRFRAQDGTATAPAYSFLNDSSSGMHLVTRGTIAFDTSGTQRMCISAGFVGIGTANPRVALEVVGDVSATTYNGPGGTAGAPHYTFSDDRTTGVFFPGANMIGMTAGGTERMRISNGFIGIGTTPSASSALDVSGVFRIIGRNGNITFDNGTIDVSGTPLVSTTGAFSNAATTSNVIGGVTLSNFDLSMASTGRILGMTSNSNFIGGVTLSNFDLSLISTGKILAPTGNSNRIGGVTLSNFDLSMASTGRILGMTSNSNFIGGVTLSNFDVSLMSNGQVRTMTGSSNYIGGVTLSNFDVSLMSSGRFRTMTGTSNYIGGVTLSNFDVSLMSNGQVRTMTGSSNYIGGVTLSNFDVSMTGAGRILGSPTSSNRIGGVTLGNSNVFTGNGSATIPTYSFTNDPSTGLHLAGGSQLAFDTSGVRRMCISGGFVGIGSTITSPFSALDLSDGTLSFRRRPGFSGTNSNNTASIEIGGGYDNGAAGIGAFPAIAFQWHDGGYRHFIRSRHAGTLANNSGIDFLINSGTDASSTAPGTWNSNMLSVTGVGLGIGTNRPSTQLEIDASGVGFSTLQLYAGGGGSFVGGGGTGSISNIPRLQFSHLVANSTNQTYTITGEQGSNANNYGLSFGGYGNSNVIRMDMGNRCLGINTSAPSGGLDISYGSTSLPSLRVTNVPLATLSWGGLNRHTIDISGGVRIIQDASLSGPTNNDPRILPDSLTLQSHRGQASNGSASIVFRSALDNAFYGRIYGIDRQTIPGNAYIGDLVFQTANSGGSLPEVMRLTWNERVGIGTRDPESTLDISCGSGNVEGLIVRRSNTNNGGISVSISNVGGWADLGVSYSNASWNNASTLGDVTLRTRDTTKKVFLHCGTFATAPMLTVTNTAVGIGQTSPGYPLDVTGSARITGGLIFSVQSI